MNDTSPPSSPLDPYLARFLGAIQDMKHGFQPGSEGIAVASRIDVPPAFIDALFTSARTRGLLKPVYGRGRKVRWTVSPSGLELIQASQAPEDADS